MDHTGQTAVELTLAIKGGDIPALTRLLAARPGLATARITGPKGPAGGIRTPLHWAASSDDADVEAPDGSIGTPLENAVGYGCWHVARLLVARGARVDKLWTAAALGIVPRRGTPQAGRHGGRPERGVLAGLSGGQRRAAELLLSRGAAPDTRRENLAGWLRERAGA